jgi:hypothetical protein
MEESRCRETTEEVGDCWLCCVWEKEGCNVGSEKERLGLE